MKILLTITLLLGLTGTALSNTCPKAVGLEVTADGKVVKGELGKLLTKLASDQTPQARAYAQAVEHGRLCPPQQCASVVIITRRVSNGAAESASLICKQEMI